jgi:hypothetical protein
MERYHPAVLPTFLAGWEALPSDVKESWLHPTYNLGHPFRGWDKERKCEKWKSWTEVLFRTQSINSPKSRPTCLPPRNRAYDSDRGRLIEMVNKEMSHEGILLDMPLIPDDVRVPEVRVYSSSWHKMDPEEREILRDQIVRKLVDEYIFQMRAKVAGFLEGKILEEGIGFLKPLLQRKSVFKVVEKSDSDSSDDDWSSADKEEGEDENMRELDSDED